MEMGPTGAGERMGTNEAGTASTSGRAGGPDAGATLIDEIRRVLSRIDAHAAGTGQAPDAPTTAGSASPAPLPAPGAAPSTPSSPASASPPSNAT